MKIIQANDKGQWDGWLKQNCARPPFLQSWAWGDILLAEGKNVERLAVIDNGEIIAQAQVVYQELPLGWKYGFCPKGPVMKFPISNFQFPIINLIAKYLRNKSYVFWRIEPRKKIPDTGYSISRSIDVNPRATTILDIARSEEELLKIMKQKTRYNIQLARKKGLKINDEKDLNSLIKLSERTAGHDEFRLHPKSHYDEVLLSAASYQLSAVFQNQTAAICVFIGFGHTFTYLYGASNYEFRNLMAPYLLQWEGIRLAKRLGYRYYDFFGITPRSPSLKHPPAAPRQWRAGKNIKTLKQNDNDYEYDAKHQYAGMTKFKLGFGGEIYEEPGTFDLVISPRKYFIYKTVRKIRRLIVSSSPF